MPILREYTYNLEGISKAGPRENQAQEMQKMWGEIYPEVRKMIDTWDFEDLFYGYDGPPSLVNFMKLRDLRTFLRATEDKLEELEKDAGSNQEKILLAENILEAVKREIDRLERKSLYWEFGLE